MPEPEANQPIYFSSFADWCKHKDSLSKEARHTVEELLKEAGTSDCNEAEKVLSNLTELYLYNNLIRDITPLSALTNLTSLSLGYNPIRDITPLSALTNLTKLSLYSHQITDITPLSGLSNLTELHLTSNQITDITPLSGLTNLTELHLTSSEITDIIPLSGLTNLTELYLNSNQITDITPLLGLTNLNELCLTNSEITDITPLSGLTNLTQLSLICNQITNITPLSELTKLTELYLGDNEITDITPLSALINLTKLSLGSNQITDITSLSALTNLTQLFLDSNQITDITSLSALTNLTQLSLDSNQITDITSLSALTNLTELKFDTNQITDITPLWGLTNLTELYLHNNPITVLNLSSQLTQKYQRLSTAPIDSQKATERVKKIYAAIGLETPQVIVCSSPQVADIKLLKQLKIDRISQDKTSEIAEKNLVLGNSLLRELIASVDIGVAGWELGNALWNLIILEPNSDRRLVSEFQEFVKNYLEPELSDFLEQKGACGMCSDSYEEMYLQSVGADFLLDSNYLQPLTPTDLVKEIHLTEFFISTFGVTLDEKAQEIFRCKQQLFEDCGWILPFEKICLVCDRPLHLRFDSANELHAEGEPAIAFADGYSLYFHHGVKLPEEYGKVHPDRWQAEWLLSEENAELRRLLIQRIGYDRICQELEVTELDSWQEYTLLSIEFDDDFDDDGNPKPVYLLKMTCPSTGHIHALRVPPEVRSSSRASLTAQEAIRWVNWDIDPEEFSVQT
ncbi:leucine-rich repeat domain-containing protein [Microcoleus sp. Pol12B4]|uniref:leucine-rich repeat domain-containing protein n=1 Tax=Microcoleus sp. Pol12B4 TaxID=3055395 RepID=UPI002FD1AED9